MTRALVPLLALSMAVPAHANTPDVSAIIRLAGTGSVAHGCPVAADKAYTNAHVTRGTLGLSWTSGGSEGVALETGRDRFRDLATIAPRGRFPRWYPVAKEAPKEGDKLTFVGYEWRSRKEAFAERVFEVRALREFPGHLAYSPAGTPGSSGSCVLNAKGEIVGINMGAMEVGPKDKGEAVGIAVAMWGRWGGIEE